MLSKLNLAVIGVSIAGAVLWIEHTHRVDIAGIVEPANAVSRAAVCPENENVPYSADCITFMQGDVRAEMEVPVERRIQLDNPRSTPVALEVSGSASASDPACLPNNENMPYSASCIRFMSGWFWRPDRKAIRP